MTEEVTDLFKRTGRVSDAIGRLGSLEFAIIAPATGADGARRLVARFQDVLQKAKLSEGDGSPPMRFARVLCGRRLRRSAYRCGGNLLRATTALRHVRQTHDDTYVDRSTSCRCVRCPDRGTPSVAP